MMIMNTTGVAAPIGAPTRVCPPRTVSFGMFQNGRAHTAS